MSYETSTECQYIIRPEAFNLLIFNYANNTSNSHHSLIFIVNGLILAV